MEANTFAAYGLTLLIAHHVGDYWIQTHHQATSKGARNREGALACLAHVATYTLTTAAGGALIWGLFGLAITPTGFIAGQLVSAITHYWADRRYTLAWLASKIGKTGYYNNGGAPALDQSWHWTWLGIAAILTTTI